MTPSTGTAAETAVPDSLGLTDWTDGLGGRSHNPTIMSIHQENIR